MNIIETTAPIKIEELKKYFADKETCYIINYEASELKGAKLLTYLSNLDIPCDIELSKSSPLFNELVLEYLNSPFLVSIPMLEKETICLLLEYKKVAEFGYAEFITANNELLDKWASILDSLILFNTYCVNSDEFKDSIRQMERYDDNYIIGANFVSLLKYEDFYDFYTTIDNKNFKYHDAYFNNYMFKGKNLYTFWATHVNPVFIMTWAATADEFDSPSFINAVKKDIEDIQHVTPI
jgi:hypothetical protein